uniref:Cyclin-like domain-containing protein n=1 Tax=Parascaris univalens TaxID=6257 RepID=A0A915B7E3_PARUN
MQRSTDGNIFYRTNYGLHYKQRNSATIAFAIYNFNRDTSSDTYMQISRHGHAYNYEAIQCDPTKYFIEKKNYLPENPIFHFPVQNVCSSTIPLIWLMINITVLLSTIFEDKHCTLDVHLT